MQSILAYIPVLHAGYLEFLDQISKNSNSDNNISQLWLIDPNWARSEFAELDYLRKEIRLVTPAIMKRVIAGLYPQLQIAVLNDETLQQAQRQILSVLSICDEDVSKLVADKFFPKAKLELYQVFLRWDIQRVKNEQQVNANVIISQAEFDKTIMTQAFALAGNSNDWWRHVGAVLIDRGRVVAQAYNHHVPTPIAQYVNGDPRTLASSGVAIEVSTSVHAEGAVIAEAAKKGIKTAGLDLYVTTFPCPYCARLIVGTGVARLFFTEGYNQLESQELLENAGVKIIQVKLESKIISRQNRATIVKPYPNPEQT